MNSMKDFFKPFIRKENNKKKENTLNNKDIIEVIIIYIYL